MGRWKEVEKRWMREDKGEVEERWIRDKGEMGYLEGR